MSDQLAAGGRRTEVAGLAARQAGEPVRGDVLLVPGYTGSKEDFAPLLDPLAAVGLRVTAVDLPGQYESPGPVGHDGYSPTALAAAVHAVIDELGTGPVRLLGHSYGGLVARAAVLARPAAVRSLVLLCSGPAALDGDRRARLEQLEPVLREHGLATVYSLSQAAARTDPGWVEPRPELAAFYERRFLASTADGLLGMGAALRAEPDRVAELAAAGVPVLVACGERDDAWAPAVQQDMAQRLGAPFVVIPDAAHSPAIEHPAATVAVLQAFWADESRVG
ncbi:MAG: alpha/beta fold hydrolase [Jatrophihabitans sp.]|uniref:alpha/beta fold hydrolase n=1 Tax=Jatrophihabitans sp. TaxID=1932789 RepID=UPI003F7E32F9